MGNKITLVLGIGVVALAGLASFLYWQNVNLAAAKQEGAVSGVTAGGTRMSVVTVSQADDFYNIQAEYPQFDGADPSFNGKISSTVDGLIAGFKKEAKDNFDARNATMPPGNSPLQKPQEPFDFIAAWTPAQSGPRYVSFMADIYYFSGGAHGTDQIFAFNYDLQNKKEITIADFLGSADNLDKLAKLSRDQITEQLKSDGLQMDDSLTRMIDDGTKATPDNYRNFTFGYGKLTVYFEQYQVAPGSAGSLTVVFYKNDLDQEGINTSYLAQ